MADFEKIKKQVDKFIEQINIDVEELPSYHYDRNPYGVEDALIGTSGGYDWDADEEYQAQLEKALEILESESIFEYIDADDIKDSEQEEYQKLTIEYIKNKMEE